MNGIRGSEKSGQALLTTLEAAHPEWRPILAVIEAALLEVQRRVWVEYVPAVAASGRRRRAASRYRGTREASDPGGRRGSARAIGCGSYIQDDHHARAGSARPCRAAATELEVPDRFKLVPEGTPAGSPRNVAQGYTRFVDTTGDDGGFEPDFDLAVKRHRLIDA